MDPPAPPAIAPTGNEEDDDGDGDGAGGSTTSLSPFAASGPGAVNYRKCLFKTTNQHIGLQHCLPQT